MLPERLQLPHIPPHTWSLSGYVWLKPDVGWKNNDDKNYIDIWLVRFFFTEQFKLIPLIDCLSITLIYWNTGSCYPTEIMYFSIFTIQIMVLSVLCVLYV